MSSNIGKATVKINGKVMKEVEMPTIMIFNPGDVVLAETIEGKVVCRVGLQADGVVELEPIDPSTVAFGKAWLKPHMLKLVKKGQR